ncbi:hypothetical protein Voc01_078600 [Virgisporangium ochraceum]|uniref:Uncharacterized protein n=1 Tax=Virgisporangium ochraceum TaxID=65505 RepID=A0A8J4EFS2_9ACTN|nr:hypothetical protein Voc01_078600 [Virgisporangium ochraceum]
MLVLLALVAGCGAGGDVTATPARSASTGASPPGASPSDASPPASTGATTLIAFAMVSSAGTAAAAEVRSPDDVDRFVGGPPDVVATARAAVARHAGSRMFAFVLAGCQNTGATLSIRAGRVTAALTGGEGIACLVAEYFLAVFAVPAHLVPPDAKVSAAP